MSKSQKKLVIVDGNALVHRAFHALPPTLTTKSGEIVNAVYGFTTILFKVLKDLKPDYLAVTFDLAGPTFRHKAYKEYKATRVKQADELYAQFPRVKQIVRAFNIPIYELGGYEADDVIATIVRDKRVQDMKTIIVTGDMDTLQLVDNNTEVYTMRQGLSDTMTYTVDEVKRRFDGLTPAQMIDYKGLRGDPSDNIPGVRGIGEKGAITLLKEFKTLENIYKNLNSKKIPERYRALLAEQRDNAIMSKKLAQMDDRAPIKFSLSDSEVRGYDVNDVVPLLQELEFKSLISKLPKELQRGKAATQSMFELPNEQPKKVSDARYTLIDSDETFNTFFTELSKQKTFVIDTETDGLDPFANELLGISFSWEDKSAFYLPTSKKQWLEKIKPILANPKIHKVGHNIKFDTEVLETAGLPVYGIHFDSMIASYLINPGSRQHGLDGLVFTELGYQMQPIEELIGKGKNQISLKDVPLEKVSWYSCEDADFTHRLIKPLTEQLKEKNNLGLLEKIEMPLVPVLAHVERNGVLIDTAFLKTLGARVNKELNAAEEKIYKLAGTKFNIASPIQLKEILFDRLEISTQGIGKTKTGISTAAEQLEKLKDTHPIIEHIMKFRELAKLKSTYLDALPKLVDLNGRIHTSFNQTVAATGRLSSSEPNLQNIPVRTELGQQIRKAFIAPRGYKIISVDYSQIELRIIASLAEDKKMIESFKKNEDIHIRTAADIHGVPLDKVTKQMRYAAKAVNFGIIYGQGATGLAAGTGISRAEAMDFIDRYFELHTSIRDYLDRTKAFAREAGYVETFFGRRRYLPEINSSIQQVRAGAERAAINHPIQGTAADLMKLAMIHVNEKLSSVSPKSKMILQVHDELVLEVPNDEIKKVATFVQKEMEEVYTLRAPVETHASAGPNWGDLQAIE